VLRQVLPEERDHLSPFGQEELVVARLFRQAQRFS